MSKGLISVALGLLLMLPVASSQFPSGEALEEILFGADNGGQILRYQIGDITNVTDNGFSDQFNFIKLHTHELGPTAPVLRIGVVATYTVQQSNDGTWGYQLSVDGSPVEDCHWELVTLDPGGFLAGDLVTYPQFQVSCTVGPDVTSTFTESQLVDIAVSRSVLSGTPDAPVSAATNIVIERADFIVTDTQTNFEQLTGVTGLELLLFVAVIGLTIILWSRSQDMIVQYFSGVLLMFFSAIAISLFPHWVGWVPFGAAIGVLGAYMVIRTSYELVSES